MDVPSLDCIALKEVAKNIILERSGILDWELKPDFGNRLFRIYQHLGNHNIVPKQFQDNIHITKCDSRRYCVKKAVFEMLKNHILERIHLGPLDNWTKEYNDENGNFQIVRFLKDMLNADSFSNLKLLGFANLRTFESDWTTKIGQLLPNLQALHIAQISLNGSDFSGICQNFCNLKVLKINPKEVNNLNGISNLKKLEVFVAKNIEVATADDLVDLFECKELRLLDFSREKRDSQVDIVDVFLKCERNLKHLTFMSCQYTEIDENKLEKLMKTHRKLKQVLVIGTPLDYTTFPGIDLLNRATFESFVNALEHEVSSEEFPGISGMLYYLNWSILDQWNEDSDGGVDILRRIPKIIGQAMNTFLNYTAIVGESIRTWKLIMRTEMMKHLTPNDIVLLINQLVAAGYERMNTKVPLSNEIWECLNQKHILDLPYLPVNKLVSFAAKSLNKVKKPVTEAKEYHVLAYLIGRLYPENLERLYENSITIIPMVILIRFAQKQPREWMTENQSIVNMALDYIHELTKRSQIVRQGLTTFGRTFMSFFQILMQLCKIQLKGLPEQTRALEIIITLTRFENFEEECGKYLMKYVPDLVEMLKADANTAFCSAAILSSLIRCKLPKKGFYDFWSKINLKAMTFCSKTQPDQISVNLDIFLTSSILKETFLNSYLDGPKMWGLLTMKIMLEKDGNVKEKLKKFGLIEIVKNYRSKERKVMEMKENVMRLLG